MGNIDWKFLGLILICLVLAIWFGFIIGRLSVQNSRGVVDFAPVDQNTSLYDSKMATVNGKILEINGRTLLIENNFEGHKGYVELSENFTVSRIENGQNVTTSLDNTNLIEKNKDVLITATLQDNVYKITSISYLESSSQNPTEENSNSDENQ